MATTQTATYKGHSYRLLWMGQTKFGKRAHLQFRDGSKDFWCDASLVSMSTGAAPTHAHSEMCAECGDRPGRVQRADSSGIVALVCGQCATMSRYELSFA